MFRKGVKPILKNSSWPGKRSTLLRGVIGAGGTEKNIKDPPLKNSTESSDPT